MSNNNWNDPNAGQQGWNQDPNTQGGWDQNQQQGWDAQAQQPADPYAQPQQGYGQPSADPYGQPSADPYAQPAADPYAQSGGWDQNQAAYGQNYGTGFDPNMNPYGAGYPAAQPVYASWGKRALGALVDWVAPMFVFGILTSLLFPNDVDTTTTSTSLSYSMGSTSSLVSWGLTLGWWAVLAYLSQNDGKTPGRKIAGTRLVSESGGPLTFGMGFLRYVCHILDQLVCCIGFLFPLWDKERQTFADKIMKTHVIEDK